jgi:hypothetical protein
MNNNNSSSSSSSCSYSNALEQKKSYKTQANLPSQQSEYRQKKAATRQVPTLPLQSLSKLPDSTSIQPDKRQEQQQRFSFNPVDEPLPRYAVRAIDAKAQRVRRMPRDRQLNLQYFVAAAKRQNIAQGRTFLPSLFRDDVLPYTTCIHREKRQRFNPVDEPVVRAIDAKAQRVRRKPRDRQLNRQYFVAAAKRQNIAQGRTFLPSLFHDDVLPYTTCIHREKRQRFNPVVSPCSLTCTEFLEHDRLDRLGDNTTEDDDSNFPNNDYEVEVEDTSRADLPILVPESTTTKKPTTKKTSPPRRSKRIAKQLRQDLNLGSLVHPITGTRRSMRLTGLPKPNYRE